MKKVNKDSWFYQWYVKDQFFHGTIEDMNKEEIKIAISEKKSLPEDNNDLYLGAISYCGNYIFIKFVELVTVVTVIINIMFLAYAINSLGVAIGS